MHAIRKFFSRLRALFAGAKLDSEMDEEMRAHIELRTDANIAAGMEPAQARLAARRQFGWIEIIKEDCRDQRGFPALENLLRDVRHASRQLQKSRGFALAAILILALGIGANTVVFSVAKAVLLRPLGFNHADRLVWLRLLNHTGTVDDSLSWREIEDVRESTQSFESIATYSIGEPVLEQAGQAELVRALWATPNLADTLGIRPSLGRMFEPGDARQSAEPVILISHEFWQSRFGGRPEIIGKNLRLDGQSRTVIGVLPPNLQFPPERSPSAGIGGGGSPGLQSFWLPMLEIQGSDRTSRGARMFVPIARLKPNLSEEGAHAELQALGARLAKDFPETNRGKSFDLVSLRDRILGSTKRGIPLLGLAVAAVLMICCVNLANLLLARGVKQRREQAVRVALGASRARIIQGLLTQSILLSLLGGALGILLAETGLRGIRFLASASVPFIQDARLDNTALLFTVALSLLTALVFGLLPAWSQSQVDAAEALRSGGRSIGASRHSVWERGLLVGQIALVLVLLSSAGLLLESFRRLLNQDLGYSANSVVMLDLSVWDFETNEELCRLYRKIHAQLSALPGVQSVGTVSSAPLTGKWIISTKPEAVGRPVPEAERVAIAGSFVGFDYFQAIGTPLVEGRFFRHSELNDNGPNKTIILNEAAAAVLFPGKSAIGGRVTLGSSSDPAHEVVGVVKNTRDVRLEEAPQPRFYWHYAFGGAQILIRSTVPHHALIPMVRDVVQKIDSRILRQNFQTMSAIVSATVAERRFLMVMAAIYAALSLAVAAIGIFGVVAYQIAQRRNEFGIRLALGATSGSLLRLVLFNVGKLTLIGLAIGLALSIATNRLLTAQLFGLSPHDPLLLAIVCALLLVVSLSASFIPALQASRTDPMKALRHD